MQVYLRSVNELHEKILLKDDVPMVLGRSIETKIQDKRCSRNQIEVTASYAEKAVTIKQLGTNPSCVDNNEIKKGEVLQLKEGQTLCIVGTDFPYQLQIEQLNEADAENNNTSKKRTIGDYFGGNKAPSKKPKRTADTNEGSEESSVSQKLKLLQSHQSKPIASTSSESNVMNEKSVRDPGWYSAGDGLLAYDAEGLLHSTSVVAFDMDGTIITTKSGKTFATDYTDWKILYSEIPGKLKKLFQSGSKLVIITNQLGIGKGKVKESDFKKKVENILKVLGVPFQVLAITKRGKFRKPNIGSYRWLKDNGNGRVTLENFIYVGDAAGRDKNWAPGRKKDFSCSDRLFAMNLGVDFHTPEEYFLGQKPAKFQLPDFNPSSIKDLPLTDGGDVTTDSQEVVILVGYPASGKSTFAKNHLGTKGYDVINRDTLKTWQKCVAACDASLSAGRSVAIDNTNPDVESRQRYINCAKKRGCPCRCFVMNVSIEHAMHNNRFRELTGSEHDVIPRMILYSYRKKYVEPKLSEGFSEIVKINFVPEFKDDDLRKMYSMYTD